MELLGRNQKCVRFSARKKHAFAGRHYEGFTLDIHLHFIRQNVEKLIFSRVHMGRWFVALSHLKDNEVESTAVVCRPAIWLTRLPMHQVELPNPGDLFYALGPPNCCPSIVFLLSGE